MSCQQQLQLLPWQTYIAWIEHGRIFLPHFWKHVTLVFQEPVHVSYEAEVILVPRCLADSLPPFF